MTYIVLPCFTFLFTPIPFFFLLLIDLLSPGAESDVVMEEGCDDHDGDRHSPLNDDMEESLVADSAALLEAGHCELGDFQDQDPDESNRIIR